MGCGVLPDGVQARAWEVGASLEHGLWRAIKQCARRSTGWCMGKLQAIHEGLWLLQRMGAWPRGASEAGVLQ